MGKQAYRPTGGVIEPKPVDEEGQQRAAMLLANAPTGIQKRMQRTAARSNVSRAAAMKLKCLECCAWNLAEVKRCEITACALHPWRPQ